MKLEGQVALITGASRGLGLSIARALGAEGAGVACLARPGRELESAVEGLKRSGIDATALPADVTASSEVEAAVRSLAGERGGLDIAVLNAGTWKGAPVHETSEEM